MSVDATLDQAFTTLLGKAIRDIEDQVVAQAVAPRTSTIMFQWSGGGVPLDATLVDPILVEVPYDSNIVWVHVYAGDGAGNAIPVTASAILQFSRFATFEGTATLTGAGIIDVVNDAAVNVNITNWVTSLLTGDILTATLTAYLGTATWLVIAVLIRSVETATGIAPVSSDGNTVLDGSGNTVISRV